MFLDFDPNPPGDECTAMMALEALGETEMKEYRPLLLLCARFAERPYFHTKTRSVQSALPGSGVSQLGFELGQGNVGGAYFRDCAFPRGLPPSLSPNTRTKKNDGFRTWKGCYGGSKGYPRFGSEPKSGRSWYWQQGIEDEPARRGEPKRVNNMPPAKGRTCGRTC